MPPQRIRNGFDDSRSEASSTKDKPLGSGPIGVSKVRRNGSNILPGSTLKGVTNAQPSNATQGVQDTTAGVSPNESLYVDTTSFR